MEPTGISFVGREAELARLGALAASSDVVVVAGPPGVGKSRLVARWLAPGRGVRADLGAARDLEDALRRVARALELEFGPSDGQTRVVERIGQVLSSRQAVVLWLDDADAIIEHLSQPLARWRGDARVVLTSRRAVLEAPHAVLHVDPLPHEEAVALLIARARAVRPDFVASDAQRPSLDELVERLDALPLAIELVAPRLRLLSPAQLLARLANATGDALSLAIERSFELLHPWERDALEQCAVFRDGFDLEAAEAVIDLSAHRSAPDVLTVLEALSAQSLLRTQTAPELPDEVRILPFGAVREHAASALARDADRLSSAEARHARYFAGAAERWDAGIESPDEAACTARLIIELPNLEAAFEHSAGELRARLGLVLHMAYQRRGPFGRQRELVERVRALAEPTGDAALRARSELAWARLCRWEGSLEESDAALTRALAAAVSAGDVALEASVARNAAANRFRAGDREGFQRHIEHALEAAERSGRASDEVNALNGLGFLHAERGQVDRAQAALERALRLAQGTEIPGLIALVHGSLSALMLKAERLEEAERHSSAAIAAYASLRYLRQSALEHLVRCEARLWMGALEGAKADAGAALDRARGLGLDAPLTRALSLSGRVAFFMRDFAGAREQLEAALARMADGDAEARRTWAYVAASCAMLGHRAAAQEAMERAGDDDVARALRAFLAIAAGEAPTLEAARSREARRIAELARSLVAHAGPTGPRLDVAEDDRWFRVEEGESVDLTRKRALRAVLGGLVAQHLAHPGEPLTIDGVLEAGWPGERMSPESGSRRVYVTINRLRNMGLGELLLTTGEGYMLAPQVDLRRSGG